MTEAPPADIAFAFDGKRLIGRAGDTVAAALLRNGVALVGRSFRHHRPRGVFALGADEPNAWLTINGTPTARATQVALCEGLDIRSQNVWPSLRFDVGRLLGAATTWLPPAFYYKTFKWPGYRFYESAIRGHAGLGKVPTEPVEGRQQQRHEQRRLAVDVLIIGGGASGVAAARSRAGANVLLVDDGSPPPIDGIEVLAATTAVAIYDDRLVLLAQRTGLASQRLLWVRAATIVIATGAAERPLLFANNDRPGVMLGGAAEVYQRDHGVDLGRVVVFTNNDGGAETAVRLSRNGVAVKALVDTRADGRTLAPAGVVVHRGWEVKDTRGRSRLSRVVIGAIDGTRSLRLDCDTLCVAGGWNPRLQLYSQAGGELAFDAELQCFVPAQRCIDGIVVVGRAAGQSLPRIARHTVPIGRNVFVDLAYDVTTADIAVAVREGFDAPELVKRFTTVGMAPDQGKTSNVNAVLAIAQLRGISPAQVGTTTMRPPYEPVGVAALAGSCRDELARPIRRLPLHDWHVAQGADLEVYSGWWRSAVYRRAGESEFAAIEREVRHTRNHVSVFDGSSLTKIRVVGRDAAEFLHRIYANSVRNLRPGQIRYGLMLNDEGIVKDDGVLACLAAERYLVSASSAGGGAVYLTMDRLLQTEWCLHVAVELVTTQWCTLCLCGPRARACVGELFPELPADMPHMSVHETRLVGVPILVMAVSFTGERSFEISVAAERAVWLCEAIARIGVRYDLAPLGLEALDVLRLEKGYLEVGVDTDVDTAPHDIGWARALQQKRGDFIGRRSLSLPVFGDARRKELVGLSSASVLPIGGAIVDAEGALQGYVTSSAWSPTLMRPIALALLADGRARHGAALEVVAEGNRVVATVTESRFFDPDNARLRD